MAVRRIGPSYTCRYIDLQGVSVHAVLRADGTDGPLLSAHRKLLSVPMQHRETREERNVLVAFSCPLRARATAEAHESALALPVIGAALRSHAQALDMPLVVLMTGQGEQHETQVEELCYVWRRRANGILLPGTM